MVRIPQQVPYSASVSDPTPKRRGSGGWSLRPLPALKRLPTMRETRFNPWVGKIPWGRKWQPTPVCLPGKSYGQKNLVVYSPWSLKRVGHDVRLNKCNHYPDFSHHRLPVKLYVNDLIQRVFFFVLVHVLNIKFVKTRDFPAGPVVRTQHPHCQGP